MNAFARRLRQCKLGPARISVLNPDGVWRLDPAGDLWASLVAAPWSCREWVAGSHPAISPDILFIALPDRFSASPPELEAALLTAVKELREALNSNVPICSAIPKNKRRPTDIAGRRIIQGYQGVSTKAKIRRDCRFAKQPLSKLQQHRVLPTPSIVSDGMCAVNRPCARPRELRFDEGTPLAMV
jgi:hypothetical protein